MTLCLPSCVMANRARSVCPLYRRVTSAISDIAPASFGVPSTLKTGMGLRKERVGMSFAFAYSASMNNPSAPQSRRAWRLCLQPEVVSMSTSRSRELELRIAEIVNFCGRRRSQRGKEGVSRGGNGAEDGICTSFVSSSEVEVESITSSTTRQLKRLLQGSGGVLITRCETQNPIWRQWSLHCQSRRVRRKVATTDPPGPTRRLLRGNS